MKPKNTLRHFLALAGSALLAVTFLSATSGDWLWAGMGLMMLVPATVVIVAVILVVGHIGRDPRSVLDDRLARGEITVAEHKERMDALRRP